MQRKCLYPIFFSYQTLTGNVLSSIESGQSTCLQHVDLIVSPFPRNATRRAAFARSLWKKTFIPALPNNSLDFLQIAWQLHWCKIQILVLIYSVRCGVFGLQFALNLLYWKLLWEHYAGLKNKQTSYIDIGKFKKINFYWRLQHLILLISNLCVNNGE